MGVDWTRSENQRWLDVADRIIGVVAREARRLKEAISGVLGIARQSHVALEMSEDEQITLIWHKLQDALTPPAGEQG